MAKKKVAMEVATLPTRKEVAQSLAKHARTSKSYVRFCTILYRMLNREERLTLDRLVGPGPIGNWEDGKKTREELVSMGLAVRIASSGGLNYIAGTVMALDVLHNFSNLRKLNQT